MDRRDTDRLIVVAGLLVGVLICLALLATWRV